MNGLGDTLQRVLQDPPDVQASDIPLIRSARLSGFVHQRLPKGHPLRLALREDLLVLAARHAVIRQELRPLLRAWAEAGIPVLLMKGFALAEFEYDTPGERFYGDVDLMIPNDPELISRAVHLAIAHGWRSDGQHAEPEQWTHECAHLYSPGGQARLDVHRFVTAWLSGPQDRVRALTEQVWSRALPTDWEGIPVLRPSPVDRVVVNLALGRCWGGDTGGLKPADYIDLSVLRDRHALSWAELSQRAQELGAMRTWTAFQATCHPEASEFELALMTRLPKLQQAVHRDEHRFQRPRWASRLKRTPRLTIWTMRLLPDLFMAAWAYLRGGDPRPLLHSWTGSVSSRRLDTVSQRDLIDTVRWWTRLLYPRQSKQGVCVPRASATYRALRRYGHPAVFVSGVARTPDGITGHAWVEDDRGVMDAYGEPLVRLRFKEVFRIPDQGT